MRNWFMRFQPNPWLVRKLAMLAILVGVGLGAFLVGRRQNVNATPPGQNGAYPGNPGVDERRAVAYIYENIPITRAELGEYLIARFGGERLEFLVDRKIVEMECARNNVFVSDAEVEARFKEYLRGFGTYMREEDFVSTVLRRFNKTLYEFKEDSIRPTLMMQKLVRNQVHITEVDLKEGFDARYGPKVECRIIVVDGKAGWNTAMGVYERARKGSTDFIEEAKRQFIPKLAQDQGKVPPIHKHFGDKKMEEIAFSMKPGDVSVPLQMPDQTYVIMMCERLIPAETKVSFEAERMKLSREMFDLRVEQRIPEEIKRLREAAKPRYMIAKQEARGSMPSLPAPSQPTVRTDVPKLVPGEVVAPGYTPTPNTSTGPAPVSIFPQMPASLAAPTPGGAPTDKK